MELRLKKVTISLALEQPLTDVAVQADVGVTVPATAAALESGVCRWSFLAILVSHS